MAKQFGFIIDGVYLIVNRDTVSGFIDSLERTFKEWEETENFIINISKSKLKLLLGRI